MNTTLSYRTASTTHNVTLDERTLNRLRKYYDCDIDGESGPFPSWEDFLASNFPEGQDDFTDLELNLPPGFAFPPRTSSRQRSLLDIYLEAMYHRRA